MIYPYKFTSTKLKIWLYARSKEAMRLLESTEKVIVKDKKFENVLKLETVDVILMLCNVVKNSYQQASKVLCTFMSDKQIGQLMIIVP